MNQQRSVVVVGAGVMGNDIAAFFYAAGWHTQLVEPAPARRDAMAHTVLAAAQTMGIHQAGGSVEVVSELDAIHWDTAELMIECAPEKLAVKQAIFQALDRSAPAHVALTSNSSGFPISAIGEGCSTQARMLGLPFFMPAHLVPAVEVVRSVHTNEAVAQRISDIMREVRKRPVQVKRDVPGFLANRIQHAMMREAIALVDEGFASAEDVEEQGETGRRWRKCDGCVRKKRLKT
jgi:3-hydroxybutyryl-CoA dehydrogenase